MDKLLNLLEKYRCHLNRGNKTSAEFLQKNFAEYIEDVGDAILPADNPLVGKEMCNICLLYTSFAAACKAPQP